MPDPHRPPDLLWFKKWFEKLEREHKLILHEIRHLNDGNQIRFSYKVGPVTNKPRKLHTMLEVETTNEQQIQMTLRPVTGGVPPKPAEVDGVPTWEVISGASTVTVADDGMSAQLVSSDDPGDTEFLVKADADLGEGVIEISDIIRYHVKGAQAANLGLSAGEITPK